MIRADVARSSVAPSGSLAGGGLAAAACWRPCPACALGHVTDVAPPAPTAWIVAQRPGRSSPGADRHRRRRDALLARRAAGRSGASGEPGATPTDRRWLAGLARHRRRARLVRRRLRHDALHRAHGPAPAAGHGRCAAAAARGADHAAPAGRLARGPPATDPARPPLAAGARHQPSRRRLGASSPSSCGPATSARSSTRRSRTRASTPLEHALYLGAGAALLVAGRGRRPAPATG